MGLSGLFGQSAQFCREPFRILLSRDVFQLLSSIRNDCKQGSTVGVLRSLSFFFTIKV
jgi:hypothetical protein